MAAVLDSSRPAPWRALGLRLPWLVWAAALAPAAGSAGVDGAAAWQIVTIEGRSLPAALRISAARLELLRVLGGKPERIPFQVDEREAGGGFALPDGPAASGDEAPGVLDDNDLLVFAARDTGDRAAVADATEIRVTDPITGDDTWVYLRVAPITRPPPRDDVDYDPATDTVRARRYTLGFGPHTPAFFAFADANGGRGRNVLDRVKARVTARVLWGLLTFRRNEEDLSSTVLAWKDGPVRVIRRAQMKIRLGYGLPEPVIVAEDTFTADAFEGPVAVRLPFDLRYVFGDLTVRIFLDFLDLDGHQLFSAGLGPIPVGCGAAAAPAGDLPADWFGMSGPEGTFIHALRISPTLQSLRRLLYVASGAPQPDPPESAPGNCPGVGYTLAEWGGIGRGTHSIDMVIRALDRLDPAEAQAFLATLERPLAVRVTPAGLDRARLPGAQTEEARAGPPPAFHARRQR